MRRLLALGLLFALAGCSAPPDTSLAPSPPNAATASTAPAQTPAAATTPVSVDIYRIGAHSSLIATGLNPDGTLEVPDVTDPGQASWYEHSPVPGDVGPAVVLGHVSGRTPGATRSTPGVFAQLHELEPGDTVQVERSDGSVVRFRITGVRAVPKDRFPTTEIYRDVPNPQLLLITCGGELDVAARSYKSNIIARAVYTP